MERTSVFHGLDGLRIEQLRRGPRVSQEALLAVREALPFARRGWVLDLGTGTGVLGLGIAHQAPEARVLALEIQPRLARLALRNARRNRLANRFRVLRGDARDACRLLRSRSFRLVVVNPPHHRLGTGRLSPHPLKAAADHELSLNLGDVAATAHHVLQARGALVLVHAAERLVHSMQCLQQAGLEPKSLRFVHHSPSDEASAVILVARAGGRPGLTVHPAAIMREGTGSGTVPVDPHAP